MSINSLLEIFNSLMGAGTIVVLLFAILYSTSASLRDAVGPKTPLIVLILASLGLIVSPVIYQYFFGFPACTLCWYQRIFMWPIGFIILGTIWQSWEKRKVVFSTIKWLAIAGLPISLYHYISQLGITTSEALCGVGTTVSCDGIDVIIWNVITIPMMAGLGFISLFLILHTITKD